MRCFFCEGRVTRERGYQLVTAWVTLGKRDSTTLRATAEPPRYACRPCIRARQLGVPIAQGSLV